MAYCLPASTGAGAGAGEGEEGVLDDDSGEVVVAAGAAELGSVVIGWGAGVTPLDVAGGTTGSVDTGMLGSAPAPEAPCLC